LRVVQDARLAARRGRGRGCYPTAPESIIRCPAATHTPLPVYRPRLLDVETRTVLQRGLSGPAERAGDRQRAPGSDRRVVIAQDVERRAQSRGRPGADAEGVAASTMFPAPPRFVATLPWPNAATMAGLKLGKSEVPPRLTGSPRCRAAAQGAAARSSLGDRGRHFTCARTPPVVGAYLDDWWGSGG
jgi:hypothetical protein